MPPSPATCSASSTTTPVWRSPTTARSRDVKIDGVTIEDTFADLFTMRVARLIITGRNAKWAREAAVKLTGFATSVIGCKCEAAIERELAPEETPDGHPGVSVLFLTMDKESLSEQLIVRIGQTVQI